MISGLKRSMPCEDLLSLSPTTGKALLDADKLLDDSVSSLISTAVMSKRRRVMEEESLHIANEFVADRRGSIASSSSSSASSEESNPATAALEAALNFDEDGSDADLFFDQPITIAFDGAHELLFPSEHTPTFACTNTSATSGSPIKSISIPSPSVNMNEMTLAMACMSTAPKA